MYPYTWVDSAVDAVEFRIRMHSKMKIPCLFFDSSVRARSRRVLPEMDAFSRTANSMEIFPPERNFSCPERPPQGLVPRTFK